MVNIWIWFPVSLWMLKIQWASFLILTQNLKRLLSFYGHLGHHQQTSHPQLIYKRTSIMLILWASLRSSVQNADHTSVLGNIYMKSSIWACRLLQRIDVTPPLLYCSFFLNSCWDAQLLEELPMMITWICCGFILFQSLCLRSLCLIGSFWRIIQSTALAT